MPDRQQTSWSGGCQCGAVRYRLTAKPVGSICHCRMCQKAVGGPFAALAAIDAADLTWVRGAPALYASSSLAQRGFCAACGTPLLYRANGSSKLEVTIGSLDDAEAAPPIEQFGIEARLAWFAGLAALPGTRTEGAKYDGLANHQHPDHDT